MQRDMLAEFTKDAALPGRHQSLGPPQILAPAHGGSDGAAFGTSSDADSESRAPLVAPSGKLLETLPNWFILRNLLVSVLFPLTYTFLGRVFLAITLFSAGLTVGLAANIHFYKVEGSTKPQVRGVHLCHGKVAVSYFASTALKL